jgi:hypothetical protein
VDRLVIQAAAWVAIVLVGGVALDLLGVWIWLAFIHDGPEFPY